MIRIPERRLAPDLEGLLREHQAKVDAVVDYADRVAEAQRAWENKPRERFRPIRAVLTEMCSGEDRCMYCEDSAADEIGTYAPRASTPIRPSSGRTTSMRVVVATGPRATASVS